MLVGCNTLTPGLNVDDRDFVYSSPIKGGEQPEFDIITITPEVIAGQSLSESEAAQTAAPNGQIAGLLSNDSGYSYRLGIGDVLAITIWGRPELSTALPSANEGLNLTLGEAGASVATQAPGHVVNQNGKIYFPFVGEVAVVGKTVQEVRQDVTVALSEFIRKPQLDVRLVDFRSQTVFVSGPGVAKPGPIAITDVPLSVLGALSRAGGLLPEANASAVKLTRNGKSTELDIPAMESSSDYSHNWLLSAGDVLYIPSNRNQRVYVMGEVERQAAVPLQNGKLTLADALMDTGGINQLSSDARRLYVIRAAGGEDAIPLVYHLNARRPDSLVLATQFSLMPRDVIYVSTASVTRFNRLLSQILPSLSFVRDFERLTAR